MHAVVLEFESVEESSCTETTSRSNRFVPAEFLYRSSIAGAMLQALLFSRGINYSGEFNNALNAAQSSIQALSRWYKRLMEDLPAVAITDAVLFRESRLRAEVFNSIYRGTATALGSLKNVPLRLTDKCRHLQLKAGRITLAQERRDRDARSRCAICGRLVEIDLGLEAVDFTVLRPDPKRDALFPSIREVMTARVGADAHIFRVPGARWRVAFFSESEEDLQRAISLFSCVISDLGLGSKHSFRGKASLLRSPQWLDLESVSGSIEAPLFQPLICRDGDLNRNLSNLGLTPIGGMVLTVRASGLGPGSTVVPAVSGSMRASQGYVLRLDGNVHLITKEDLTWPRSLSN